MILKCFFFVIVVKKKRNDLIVYIEHLLSKSSCVTSFFLAKIEILKSHVDNYVNV